MIRNRTLLVFLAFVCCAAGELIPAARLADSWEPGVKVGVIGGIDQYRTGRTNLINVTQAPHNADNTGVTNASTIINAAIAGASDGDVIYLPAGTYRAEATIAIYKSGVTVRGDGNSTIIKPTGSAGGIGIDGALLVEEQYWVAPVGDVARGDTVIPIGDVSGGWVPGIFCLITILNNNDPAYGPLVVSVAGFERRRKFVAFVTAVDSEANTITLSQPIPFAMPASLEPHISTGGGVNFGVNRSGVENLRVDMTDTDAVFSSGMSSCRNCWFYGVSVRTVSNYHLGISYAANCEVRKCDLRDRKAPGTNGGGLLTAAMSDCLIEDNIISGNFPSMEINEGSTRNVFAYNFCTDVTVFGTIGIAIDANHGPHNSFNLYEGNIAAKWQSDGYFGGSSEDTLFRNWFHGTDPGSDQTGHCVNLKRFTYEGNVLCNVLGRQTVEPGLEFPTYIYENVSNNWGDGGYDGHGSQRYIYVLGLPFIGNGGYYPNDWYNGGDPNRRYAEASTGNWWHVWPSGKRPIRRGAFNSSTVYNHGTTVDLVDFTANDNTGVGPGDSCLNWITNNPAKDGTATWDTPGTSNDWLPWSANSFTEIDKDVINTLIRKGNYNYATNSVPDGESLGEDVAPNSLFRSSKPSWFGNCPWPAFSPTEPNSASYESIPAGYRFVNDGADPPSAGNGTMTVSGAATAATLNISSP